MPFKWLHKRKKLLRQPAPSQPAGLISAESWVTLEMFAADQNRSGRYQCTFQTSLWGKNTNVTLMLQMEQGAFDGRRLLALAEGSKPPFCWLKDNKQIVTDAVFKADLSQLSPQKIDLQTLAASLQVHNITVTLTQTNHLLFDMTLPISIGQLAGQRILIRLTAPLDAKAEEYQIKMIDSLKEP